MITSAKNINQTDLAVDNDGITKPSPLKKRRYLENVMNQLALLFLLGYSLEPTAQRHWELLNPPK